jgi:hypothetical protein
MSRVNRLKRSAHGTMTSSTFPLAYFTLGTSASMMVSNWQVSR